MVSNEASGLGLLESINNSEFIVMRTESVVAIKDKYPKSRFHFLVMPWDPIDTVFDLDARGVGLIKEMELMGRMIIEARGLRPEIFRMGFHAAPSQKRAHLHVISQDFISDNLLSFWDYNSFNTPFFWPPSKIINDLQTFGRVPQPSNAEAELLMMIPLKCNTCSFTTQTFADLKGHLLTHAENYLK